MKNTIIKTALITLACIIGITAIAYFIVALSAPKTLANFYNGVDNYKLTVKYLEKQYEKTGATSDLYELVVKLDYKKDADKTVKYAKTLIEKDGYYDFCLKIDGGQVNFTTNEYVYNKYVSAISKKDFGVALSTSNQFCLSYGYTKYNPFRQLISLSLSADNKQALKETLFLLEPDITDPAQNLAINQDINLLN